MTGDLIINGKDAYTEWGAFLDDGSYGILMAPPPMKPFVENKSTSENGKQIYPVNTRIDERTVTLSINFTASSREDFLSKYQSFVSELQSGVFTMNVSGIGMTFKFIYESCQSYTVFIPLAKCALRLSEPNPSDRS